MVQPIPAADASEALSALRTSEVLRGILSQNPGIQSFSVERIIASIGQERCATSLMLFSVPAIVPLSVPRGVVSMPTAALGGRLLCGAETLRLPRYILRKQISRRALAIAIHAILPVLEAAERVVRPRWHWVSHPISRRAIGFLIFLLGGAIAWPFAGPSALHALSIFVMSLGLAEADGLTILIGVVAGVTSLAVVAATGFSPRALRKKLVNGLRKLARKLGLHALARFLERLGYPRIAKLLSFEWSQLVMAWDPEKLKDGAHAAAATASPPTPPRAGPARVRVVRRSRRSLRSTAALPAAP